MQDNLVYFLDGKTYLNITNACTNRCLFCVRDIKDDVAGANLRLGGGSASAADVIAQLEENRAKIKNEITFCGYGEPLLRLEQVKEIAKYIKENFAGIKIRVNTNGHANAIHGRNILPELKGLADEFSISLNAQNEELYNKISCPNIEDAYRQMLEFARLCVQEGFKTTLSVVSGYQKDGEPFDIDVKECEKIAARIGAPLKVREWIREGYL